MSKLDELSRVHAPWTAQQVVSLHYYQNSRTVHPFTCPNHDDHPFIGGDERVLIPTVRGWICRFCDYTQDWAHCEMIEFLRAR